MENEVERAAFIIDLMKEGLSPIKIIDEIKIKFPYLSDNELKKIEQFLINKIKSNP